MKKEQDARDHAVGAGRMVFSYMYRYRKSLLLGAVCLFFANVLLLANPWILKLGIDSLGEGTTGKRLFTLASALVMVTAVSGLFRFLMRKILIGVSRRVEFDMRRDFFAHLERMSGAFYLANRTGDLMALATNDLNAVRSLVGPGVMYSMNTLVVSAFAVSLMLVLSWKLTLLALLPMTLLSFGVYHSVKIIHRLFEKVQQRFADLNSRAQENLSGIRVIKAYAREEHEVEEFRKHSIAYLRQNMRLFRVQSLLMPLLTMVAGLGALIILAYGGKQVIDGTLTLGSFVAFHGYLAMLIWPVIAIGWVMNVTQRGLASMERIKRVMDEKPDIADPEDAGGTVRLPRDRSIEFDNVRFTYPGSQDRPPALCGVTFRVHDGETVAVVGASGSGKSSVASLILRLYDPDSGDIRIGGVCARMIPLAELRRMIGLVPQEILLFSTTIGENIAFGRPDLSRGEMERYATVCALREQIAGFPRGFDTMVGERGVNLSGGQKQRVAIARALAKDPQILILDDALSSVDTRTEERILSGLREEMRRRTTLIISHRVSTVMEADRILVLDEGMIVEEGTHRELVSAGGIYAAMVRKQAIAASLEGNG